MDNKYIMAEKQDFTLNDNKNLIYIGNNEGIEYVDISEYLTIKNKFNIDSMFDFNEFIRIFNINNSKQKQYSLKGIKCTKGIKSAISSFCHLSIESLDLSNFNTSEITSLKAAFEFSKIKNLDLSSFNTSKCKDFRFMFSNTTIEKLDLSSFEFDSKCSTSFMFIYMICDTLILPNSFPINFNDDCFHIARIKNIETPNKEFYKKHKKWFKKKYDTNLILIF